MRMLARTLFAFRAESREAYFVLSAGIMYRAMEKGMKLFSN
ncbi:MAG: hypothetical protein UT24_C0003G0042 [Candidatus Woesebacteria bacterium GW2011_GWB1_39_12]|uniref:Uncharacterized protein n=1 Tax=Candidatus Woesebacteria bacterium GW2011_GWB1_39_12 TaxID=1618574 RepID=A0A0G0PTX8_9BACT|nr:MAG: hypothetical protein UT24_C0003G0042 [Candidatus Woesebacteria bacterium GW2011_GWB1_39_12]